MLVGVSGKLRAPELHGSVAILPDLVGPASAGAPVVLLRVPGQHKYPQCESSQVSSCAAQHLLYRYLSTPAMRELLTFNTFFPEPPLILSRLACITGSPPTGRGQTRFAVFFRAKMGKS